MTNKELIERYPFLIPRSAFTGEIIHNFDFENPDCTLLDDMKDGWRKAFGEQMCEELRTALIKGNYLEQYRVVQIKEKFGALRWYDNGIPLNISEEIYDIIRKYEDISSRTCVVCGKPAEYITTGWVCPFCGECINKVKDHYVPVKTWFDPEESELL